MDESVTSELSVTLYETVLCSFPERSKYYTQYVIHVCQNTQQIKKTAISTNNPNQTLSQCQSLQVVQTFHIFIDLVLRFHHRGWKGQCGGYSLFASGLTVQRSNPREGRFFSHRSRLALGFTEPPIYVQWLPGHSRGQSGRGASFVTQLHLTSKLKTEQSYTPIRNSVRP